MLTAMMDNAVAKLYSVFRIPVQIAVPENPYTHEELPNGESERIAAVMDAPQANTHRLKAVEQLQPHEAAILVEGIQNQFAHPMIVPLTMDQQQPLQEVELVNGEIATVHSLSAFVTTDADPHVCGLDHSYIIGAISNGESAWFGTVPRSPRHAHIADELDHLCLLRRTHPARQNTIAESSQEHK